MLTKKQERRLKDYVRATPKEQLAYAHVTSTEKVRSGLYRFMPLIGCTRPKEGQVYLHLSGVLLRPFESKHEGTMSWYAPLSDESLVPLAELLVALGWDGRVWPNDAGWPDGDDREAAGLEQLLKEGHLDASMVFPPDPKKGSKVINVLVGGSDPFPMPLDLEQGDRALVPSSILDRLQALMADPGVFTEKKAKEVDARTFPRFQFVST